MNDITTVSVTILDKEYQVSCPPDEVDDLTRSARFLDERMREIRDGAKVFGIDRIAVMAALNISHELLGLKIDHDVVAAGTNDKLIELTERVTRALADETQPTG